MTEQQNDGLPSKLRCIEYTLLHCGYNKREAQAVIDRMIETRVKSEEIMAKIMRDQCWGR